MSKLVYYTVNVNNDSVDLRDIKSILSYLKWYREINTIHSISVFKHVVKPIKFLSYGNSKQSKHQSSSVETKEV